MSQKSVIEGNYKAIFDSVFATLKRSGYQKRGRLFWKDHADVQNLVEFQRSRTSSKENIVFTINLSVVVKQLLDPEFDDLDKIHAFDSHLYWRLGDFLTPKADKWWAVSQRTDVTLTAQEISSSLSELALPEMEMFSKVSTIIDLCGSGAGPAMSDKRRRDFLEGLHSLRQE
jgi:hypothetical protein